MSKYQLQQWSRVCAQGRSATPVQPCLHAPTVMLRQPALSHMPPCCVRATLARGTLPVRVSAVTVLPWMGEYLSV